MSLRNVDANLLLALHALLAEKNVTRAAKRVGREQSSMSHALGRLRDHFGDPLLVPAGRAMVLTERARSLVEPVAAAVAQVERVFAASEPFDPHTCARTLHLATTDNPVRLGEVVPERVERAGEVVPEAGQGLCGLDRRRSPEWRLSTSRTLRPARGGVEGELHVDAAQDVNHVRNRDVRGKLAK